VRSLLVALTAATTLTASCASNRARKVEMDHRDIEMTPKGSFVRGTGDEVEELDEEEFYSLLGDKEAFDKIHDERSAGELMQPAGLAIASVGIAVGLAGFGFAYAINKDPPISVLGENDIILLYGLLGVGALGTVGGGYLYADGNEKAAGAKRLFDNEYAIAALEKARYGTGGATASTIARLELTTETGTNTYCSVNGVVFKPLKAFDDKNRPVKLDPERTQEWFVWQSLPEGTLGGTNDWVRSTTTTTLADIGKDIVVTVKVNSETNVSTTLQLKPDYGCKSRFDFAGAPGFTGERGKRGIDATEDGATGGSGGTGVNGEEGARGNEVDVEATALRGPMGESLVLAVITESGASTLAVFDPATAGPLVLDASGGRGGSGGDGGDGGEGGDYSSDDTCAVGGLGGSGGTGGNGGRGGDGGTIRVRADAKDVLAAIAPVVNGGAGGGEGGKGSGGSGGAGDTCPEHTRTQGARGADGVSGGDGTPGREGKVDVNVAPRASLKRLQEALATMPAFEADAARESDAPPARADTKPQPPKKKPKKK
jgi:hypothetical protein